MHCRNHPEVAEGVRPCSRCRQPYCPDCLVEINGFPYCATCKNEQLLDVRSGVDRNVLQYAGFWKRFGSIFLDGLILAIPNYAMLFGAMYLGGGFSGEPNNYVLLAYIPMYALMIGYEAIMLGWWNGQTIGRKTVGVRVVRPDGSPISKGQAWARPILKILFGCLIIFDYVPYFFTKEKTTLHDMVVGTRVVDV